MAKKKEAEEGYVLKKNSGAKIARIIIWLMLGFVFIRGIASILTPSNDSRVEQMIDDFKEELSFSKELNNETMAFAQNFAREYLTYSYKEDIEYRERIKPYVSSAVYNQTEILDFKHTAKAEYVEAYRIEQYSGTQWDVYVLADVVYQQNVLAEDQSTYITRETREQTVLKVPLCVEKGKYLVESIPVFVTDNNVLQHYEISGYAGTAVKEAVGKEVETAVSNFLKAYYSDSASVIGYYLDESADKKEFAGLDGRYVFKELVSCKSYQEPGENIVSIVEFQIKDSINDAVLTQLINLQMKKEGSKYYIISMDARVGNLNFAQ